MNELIRKRILSILPPDYDSKGESVPGRKLRGAGFTFFDPKRDYYFGKLDGNGLVRVSSLCFHPNQDEDGFGEEYVYDWWYLTDELQEVPGAGYLHACTWSEIWDKKLKEYHDRVVDMRWLDHYRKGIGMERHPARPVEHYQPTAQAEIAQEFERRKQEKGVLFRTGQALRAEGHDFFEADRDYFLKPLPEKGLVEVSAFNRYDEAILDFDGRIDYECYYDWWYLTERLERIPGFTRPINDSLSSRNIFRQKFDVIRDAAAQELKETPRKPAKEPRAAQTPTVGSKPVRETAAPREVASPKPKMIDLLKRLFFGNTGKKPTGPKSDSSPGDLPAISSNGTSGPAGQAPSKPAGTAPASGTHKPSGLYVTTKRENYRTAHVLVSPQGRFTIVDFDRTIQRFPGTEQDDVWLQYWESEKPLDNYVRYSVDFTSVGEDAVQMVWMIQPDGRYWADEYGFGMENDLEIRLYSMLDARGNFAHPFRPYSIDGNRLLP